MDRTELEGLFESTLPFYPALSESDKDALAHSSQAINFSKGDTVHDGNDCTGIILIKSGSLRLYILSEDGKELTLYRLFANDICILSASCALNSITFDVLVDAEEDSECVVIGGCTFAEISDRVPEARIFALEIAASRFSDVIWVLQQILFMSFDKRLAIFLLDEISKSGRDEVRLTHEQIAKYMGSAREVVSRMLKYFSAEGMVEISRGGIKILDKKRLRAICSK